MITISPWIVFGALAVGLYFLMSRPSGRYLRQAMDRRAGSGGLQELATFAVAKIGTDAPHEGALGKDCFRAGVGFRASTTVLIGLLFLIITPGSPLEDAMPLVGRDRWLVWGLLAVIAGYYLYWIHSYRIELRGPYLMYRTFLMTQRTCDLRLLEHFEDDGAYQLRLYFYGAPKAEIFKHVSGAKILRRRLERAVERNNRL